MTLTLVLGGARSGKSRHAQALAESAARAAGTTPLFIATAEPMDEEMRDRIARHQADRGPHWRHVDAPIDLPGAIAAHDAADAVLLVDCVTVWLGNLMHYERDVEAAAAALVDALAAARGEVVVVANEVGLSIVPETALGRRFRDMAGTLNQRIAAVADVVTLVVAGLPVRIKPGPGA